MLCYDMVYVCVRIRVCVCVQAHVCAPMRAHMCASPTPPVLRLLAPVAGAVLCGIQVSLLLLSLLSLLLSLLQLQLQLSSLLAVRVHVCCFRQATRNAIAESSLPPVRACTHVCVVCCV